MSATAPGFSCNCNEEAGPTALVFPCSGAADTGAIADLAARLLDTEDKAWMSCLAGIGGRASGLLASAAAAPVLVAIDGCPLDCAKKTLELAGFTNVRHVRVTDLTPGARWLRRGCGVLVVAVGVYLLLRAR
jgi:uncharacterized metal-binding protein